MFIIQLSDFHMRIDDEEYNSKEKIFERIIEYIHSITSTKDETILILICGDIIDHKNILKKEEYQLEYEKALCLLSILKKRLSKNKLIFAICPGNHDVVDKKLDLFDGFVKDFSKYAYCVCQEVLSIPSEKTDFIIVNSVLGEDHTRGFIDYDYLEEVIKQSKHENKFLVMHHTLLSMDEKDTSSLINASRLINIIDTYKIKAVFHGHTHGIDGTYIGKTNCLLMGVGAVFSDNYADVNSQFNLFHMSREKIDLAKNYRYNKDAETLGENAFTSLDLLDFFYTKHNYFEEESFSLSYNRLISELKVSQNPLYNITIKGNYAYDHFKRDLETNFLHLNEIGYTYEELAEKWEAIDCPDELYFNHGQRFVYQGKHGIHHVIEHLKNKPTSSRAILSTISTTDVLGKSDDSMVPSFMSIQFGFDAVNRNVLYVSLNLRALEVSRFLKINICEVYYLINQIRNCPVLNVEKIDLTIHAFRAQIHENFRCFLKSGIDTLSSAALLSLIFRKDYNRLIGLLEDKKSYSESIIIKKGMEELYVALTEMKEFDDFPSEQMLKNVKIILDAYDCLIAEGEKNSVRTERQENLYKKITQHYDKVISIIKELKRE